MPYNHQEVEQKWQKKWEKAKAGQVKEDPKKAQDAVYHLAMFPYPSGAGLHVGHVESYTAIDILTRLARMRGKHVLCPIGYDAFGLPAENYAIKTGVHPAETTARAIETFRRQMKSVGLSFDWSREISTAEPDYYKWTQWLFLLFYKHDLAYRAKAPVNWCGGCQTVLANEQVVNGACERCGTAVIQKELEQWFFRITKYADRLLAGLDQLDWPERIKAMQRNWIGRSEGVEAEFRGVLDKTETSLGADTVEVEEFNIPVFTTRPDTLMGVSYIVLAPEHPLVDRLTTPDKRDSVVAYRDEARTKTELERTQLEKEKSGVFLGSYARHPLTEEHVPIWTSDYVLMNYGTGAVMGVPAHDERDFAFATRYDLPIRQVIAPTTLHEGIHTVDEAYTGPGFLVNSGAFDGITSGQAKAAVADALEAEGKGRRTVNYRMRDWLVSRQRYWGAPIPIIWCETCGAVPVDPKALPVRLPLDVNFSGKAGSASGGKPTGASPLVDSPSFHDVTCPKCGERARRESDTMDTFVDSSWYELRYCDPHGKKGFADLGKVKYWCPVDLYVGGAEHAVLHLLYARFFAYALHDLGYLEFEEPFVKLRNQGLVLGPDGEKMSKSKGNVVNPDDIVREYGADTIRAYEMFMGPFDDPKPWDTKGVVGVRRFLDKVWNLQEKLGETDDPELTRVLHKTIKRVSEDLDAFKFNTAVAQLMICTNAMQEALTVPRDVFATFVAVLAPFAPHIAEELWERLGRKKSVFAQGWPEHDPALAKDELVKVAIQVNGKLRGTMAVAPDMSEADARERAVAEQNVAKHLEGKEIVKVIYVPGRMVNLVVK